MSVRSQSCTIIVWSFIAIKSIKTITIRIYLFFCWKISPNSIFVLLQSVQCTERTSSYCIDELNFFCDRKAREDLDAKNKKLAEMEADYGDVVPRRDFERLEAQFNVRNTKLSCEFQKL